MAVSYNDSGFSYNASNLSYDGVVLVVASATGSGNGSETATSNIVVARDGAGSGTGTEGVSQLFAGVRSATGSGGASAGDTAVGIIIPVRTASGSGTGTESATGVAFHVLIRTGSDVGTGAGTATELLISIRSATGSGVGSQNSISFSIRFRSGVASAGTGGFATTNWDIVDVFEPTNLVVELELPSTIGLDSGLLVLDDAVNGLLDTGTLGARSYYDVTQFVKEVTIHRGRSRQLDAFNAGTAQVVFNDPTRQFDPTNSSSLYFGGIIPRQPVRISVNNIRLFSGFIEDWNLDYTQPTMLTASISCVDWFSLLASVNLEEYFNVNNERSNARIQTILDLPEVAKVVPETSLETGVAFLTNDTIADSTVLLDYLQQVNRSEQGYLFMTAENVLKFVARGAASSLAVSTGSIPVFTDVIQIETDFKYLELGVQFGTELLYNRIVVKNSNSNTVQTVDDEESQIDYLVRTLDMRDLILVSDAAALTLGNYVLNQYANPIFRYDSVSVSATGITNNRKNRLFRIELAQLVRTTRNFAVGTPAEVTRYSLVEGISHKITLNEHIIQYNLNTLSYTP